MVTEWMVGMDTVLTVGDKQFTGMSLFFCGVVGLRTDGLNLRSQRAIEGLGAKKDGILRNHSLRSDGSVRDDAMYSILATEWPGVRRHLETRLWRYGGTSAG